MRGALGLHFLLLGPCSDKMYGLYFDAKYWKYSFRLQSLLLDYKDATPDKNLHPLTAALMVKHNKEMGVSKEVCRKQNISRF